MKEYIYPQNLKATATIWLWSLRDFALLIIGLLLSMVALAHLKTLIPMVGVLFCGFISMRFDDTTVMDFIRYAVKYFITSQQYFEWR